MSDAVIVAIVNGGFTLLLAILTLSISKTIKQVHVAVNSERTAMIDEVRALRDHILKMTKQMMAMKETGRRQRRQRRKQQE